jgi:hypothetical protein
MAKHQFTSDELWERIRARSAWVGQCLIWYGARSSKGYGNMSGRANGYAKPVQRVHRLAYEYFYGPIPEGLQIDHVKARGCTSTACCNPLHLEAVTPKVNTLRGNGLGARRAKQTHCKNGHPLPVATTERWPSGVRRPRICSICDRERKRRWELKELAQGRKPWASKLKK